MPEDLELTLPQALELGLRLLRDDQLDAAAHVYGGVLAHFPDQPDALHYSGLLQHRRGERDAAVASMRRSIALAPGHAWMWNNLGNVLLEQRRLDEARDAYEYCIALDPEAGDALSNLGALHRKCGRLADAEIACRRAVARRPDYAIGWFNLARVLIERGEIREGLVANSKAVVLAPTYQTGRQQVARALVLLGELDRAAEVYRQWLAEEPDNPLVRHHLAACVGDDTQPRAPDAYIEQVFDGFASSFDAKLASLGYRAPQLVAGLLAGYLPAPARQLQVADLGCGTGLCGPLVREWAGLLVGVDLSAEMLAQARRRAVYDRLEKAELVDWLRCHPARFDLLISADTLCYFGELADFARAAHDALLPDGRLFFTVEALPEPAAAPYRLQPHGRYAHSNACVQAVFAEAGFIVDSLEAETLRLEAGLPVPGWLVRMRKAPIGRAAR